MAPWLNRTPKEAWIHQDEPEEIEVDHPDLLQEDGQMSDEYETVMEEVADDTAAVIKRTEEVLKQRLGPAYDFVHRAGKRGRSSPKKIRVGGRQRRGGKAKRAKARYLDDKQDIRQVNVDDLRYHVRTYFDAVDEYSS